MDVTGVCLKSQTKYKIKQESTLNNQIEQQNLELLEQYFRDGCKWNCLQKLGVELEHFVIDRKNQKNVSYYGPDGIEELLEE